MNRHRFSFSRFLTIMIKEFVQMKRDRLTHAMMVGIPVIQLVLFGYAINFDPKDLPVAVLSAENSIFSRDLIGAMKNSGYFRVTHTPTDADEARELLETGDVQFVLNVPPDFSRRLLKGESPQILLETDATDPVATGSAISAITFVGQRVMMHDLEGPLSHLYRNRAAFEVTIHKKYNPEGATNLNIVPGLMGVILTLTMTLITGIAITRERERGTMENLLSTPARPLEVIIGKIIPYIIVGYVQVALILAAAYTLFEIPVISGLPLLLSGTLVFILANLSVGITFSTIARNQMQAMQMAFFFFLPSMMLSGFMFPFRGMPQWAQAIGSILPLTHFLRLVRGILLKGNGLMEALVNVWPIALFMVLSIAVAIKRYRMTLD